MSQRRAKKRDDTLFENALEAFARGFSFTRSFTHPYIAKRVGGMWVLRDAPRQSGDVRNEEWIAHALDPVKIDKTMRKNAKGRFAVSMILKNGEPDRDMRLTFKALGYRLGVTEPFMVHDLKRIAAFESQARIERVTTTQLMENLAKAAGSRQILPQYLNSGEIMRQYVAIIDDTIVGWVRSIVVKDATWCSSMHVVKKYRRRGIGKALLSRVLRDDKANGAKRAVLLASHTGAMLYPVVGYEQIGLLYLFMPRR